MGVLGDRGLPAAGHWASVVITCASYTSAGALLMPGCHLHSYRSHLLCPGGKTIKGESHLPKRRSSLVVTWSGDEAGSRKNKTHGSHLSCLPYLSSFTFCCHCACSVAVLALSHIPIPGTLPTPYALSPSLAFSRHHHHHHHSLSVR